MLDSARYRLARLGDEALGSDRLVTKGRRHDGFGGDELALRGPQLGITCGLYQARSSKSIGKLPIVIAFPYLDNLIDVTALYDNVRIAVAPTVPLGSSFGGRGPVDRLGSGSGFMQQSTSPVLDVVIAVGSAGHDRIGIAAWLFHPCPARCLVWR